MCVRRVSKRKSFSNCVSPLNQSGCESKETEPVNMKKFFSKKKKDFQNAVATAKAGPGHRLDGSGSSSNGPVIDDPKDAARLAVERRFAEEQRKKEEAETRRRERQLDLDKERELQRRLGDMTIEERDAYDQKQQPPSTESVPKTQQKFNPTLYTSPKVNNGFIACPGKELFTLLLEYIINDTALSNDDRLYEIVRLLQTSNSTAVREAATSRICKIVNNLIAHPEDPKFYQLRVENNAFKEHVWPAIGAEQFFIYSGFERLTTEDKGDVLQFPSGKDTTLLLPCIELLTTSQPPMQIDVYRHTKAYFLEKNAMIVPIEVPDWTYNLSGDDVKRMQKEREAEVEWWLTVCSKRRRPAPTPFKVSIVRVRFSNNAVIEALFGVHEAVGDIANFISTVLGVDANLFTLNEAVGQKFTSETAETIGELRLVPTCVLHFNYLDKSDNYPLPTPEHVVMFQEARENMGFFGVDIAAYKF